MTRSGLAGVVVTGLVVTGLVVAGLVVAAPPAVGDPQNPPPTPGQPVAQAAAGSQVAPGSQGAAGSQIGPGSQVAPGSQGAAGSQIGPGSQVATGSQLATGSEPASGDSVTPPNGVPHLPSPDNLPPGTTDAPVDPQGGGLTYLREVWHAIQDQNVSMGQALLLLAQQPMNAAPPPGMSVDPQQPPTP